MDGQELELIEGFVDEAMLGIEVLRRRICVEGVRSREDVDELFRTVHTIKGNAGMVGMPAVVDLAHEMEEVFDAWRKERGGPSLLVLHVLESALDALCQQIEVCRDLPGSELSPKGQRAVRELQACLGGGGPDLQAGGAGLDEPGPPAEALVAEVARSRSGAGAVRVPVRLLDGILRTTGELLFLSERLSFLQRGLELEAAGASELGEVSTAMSSHLEDLHAKLVQAQLESAESLFQSMARIVRDAARETEKLVHFEFSGSAQRVDRKILRSLHDPLVHLLRNAVDHGIEPAAIRAERGKPEIGTVTLDLRLTGREIRIDLSDDGGGVDGEAILRSALRKGLLDEEEAETLSVEQAQMLIFKPGFSTAQAVSQISGRGVGMDAVKQSVEALGGVLRLHSEPGAGTRVSIAVPQPASLVLDGIVLRVGAAIYLVPLDAVGGFLELEVDDSAQLFGDVDLALTGGETLSCVQLGGAIHQHERPPTVQVRLLDTDLGNLLLTVHEVLGRHRVLVRKMQVPGIQGREEREAFLLGDGRIGYVLTPAMVHGSVAGACLG